ncbi:hypothetical protein PENSPDRAFT_653792 [Peniophora sp. CONT]|nr:hypothetical protein PENSPDRAFT_653792 [Peniophora sp. CONT]
MCALIVSILLCILYAFAIPLPLHSSLHSYSVHPSLPPELPRPTGSSRLHGVLRLCLILGRRMNGCPCGGALPSGARNPGSATYCVQPRHRW